MGWCNVGPDDGAKAVADLLMFNDTIATLDLRGNGIGDAGADPPRSWLGNLHLLLADPSVHITQLNCRLVRRLLLVNAGLGQCCRVRSTSCLHCHVSAAKPSAHSAAPVESVMRPLILLQVQSTWRGPSRSTQTVSSQSWIWATTRSRMRAHAPWLRCATCHSPSGAPCLSLIQMHCHLAIAEQI